MLEFIPDELFCAEKTADERIYKINSEKIGKENYIYYIMCREYRVENNWGLIFAIELTKRYNKKIKILIYLDKNYYSKHQETFFLNGLNFLKKNLALNNIDFEISEKLPEDAAAIVFDFNTINNLSKKKFNCAAFEVDSHNIVPARYVSDKQEYSAATLRRKIYGQIGKFLTEFPVLNFIKWTPYEKLGDFIENKLNYYAEFKNNPLKNVTSNLSPYLHFGFISAQKIALEITKSNATRENKEAYLEELIVRKELADNFCLHSCNYKTFKSVPKWAIASLIEHKNDIRAYCYSKSEFEYAKTHDELWNKIQEGLLLNGHIHGYLRMYWAKKILEWSKTPEEALETAIYLNDNYALDGMDANGYVGILWSIGGLHDRAFTNRFVTGKIRYMSLEACKRNFSISEFLMRNN